MIDNRLKSLTKYINNNDLAIDIGCDHALLDIYLIKNNIVNNIIVSDISSNALDQGTKNIKKYRLENYIETRLGNGLDVLNDNDKVNTIIISGMGTNTILNILNNKYIKKINKMIIQSNRDYYELRKEVIKLGFYISNEEVIVVNNKLYINIVFIRGTKKYTEENLKYGTNNMINKDIYYNYLIDKNKRIISTMTNNIKKQELIKEIDFLNKLLK